MHAAHLPAILLLAGIARGQAETGEARPFDVEKFLAGTPVVDATVNYFSPRSLEVGQPDFGRDRDGRSVKEVTGIDFGSITIGSENSLDAQLRCVESGQYLGVRLIREAADIDRALKGDEYGILFYSQGHYPLEGKLARSLPRSSTRWGLFEQGVTVAPALSRFLSRC